MSEVLPRVTSIIKPLLGDTRHFTDYARDRGTAVHKATELYDLGDLDMESVDPAVLPRLTQYQRFIEEVQPQIFATEHRLQSVLGYTGTVDRVLRINGRDGVLDIKPPNKSPWHGVQLAAYANLAAEYKLVTHGTRWNLYLGDSAWNLVERQDPDDWRVFLNCLSVANWKRRHDMEWK